MKVFFVIVVMLISVSLPLWAMDYQGIVDQHRKMLVLMEGTSDIDPRSESIFAARNYYVKKYKDCYLSFLKDSKNIIKQEIDKFPYASLDELIKTTNANNIRNKNKLIIE